MRNANDPLHTNKKRQRQTVKSSFALPSRPTRKITSASSATEEAEEEIQGGTD